MTNNLHRNMVKFSSLVMLCAPMPSRIHGSNAIGVFLYTTLGASEVVIQGFALVVDKKITCFIGSETNLRHKCRYPPKESLSTQSCSTSLESTRTYFGLTAMQTDVLPSHSSGTLPSLRVAGRMTVENELFIARTRLLSHR